MNKAMASAIVILLASAACATLAPVYHQGVQAEIAQDWDAAIAAYERAALQNPKESVYRLALAQVRVKAGMYYAEEARREIAAGNKEKAQAAFAKAIALNPRDSALAFEAEKALAADAPKTEPVSTKIEFPIKLKAKEGVLDLRLTSETSLRAVFLSLGRAGGINIVFDETFREAQFRTDLTNVTFEKALSTICQATKNFFRIIDERTVIIVPDLPAKRIQYEISCIKTFFLSNAEAEKMVQSLTSMLRAGGKIPLIFHDKGLNSLTIRDTPQVVELAEKLIKLWDKPKGEVVVDIELMEVSRTKIRQLGVSINTSSIGIQYGEPGAADTTAWWNVKGLNLGNAANYYTTLPAAYLQFLETDSDTKVIAQPRLRGFADEEVHQLVGEKIPVPQTTWNPIGAGGFQQLPVTTFKYEDVGIDIKFTPKIHLEKEVTLKMEIKMTSMGGKGYGDLPIINTRELTESLRLRDGETAMLAGLLRDTERKSLVGIPLLKNIPVIGRLFGAEDTTVEQTDIIMTITPHIIRTVPVNEGDQNVLWVDVNADSESGAVDPTLLGQDMAFDSTPRPITRPRSGNNILIGPAAMDLPVGREFRITAGVQAESEIGMISLTLSYNPLVVNIKSVTDGGLGRSLGENAPFFQTFDNASGTCTIGFNSPQAGKGIKGGGTLASLVFEAKAPGEAVIAVSQVLVSDPMGQALTFQTGQSRIRVR